MTVLPCGCCEGVEAITPEPVANPTGQPALRYRAGRHASFLSTMLARISSVDLPGLTGFTTRELDDPSIALLDAWATVADVLTFYQERIANEGYLRTATEGRSVLELARLVGYEPRPGVAASTHLAFTMEKGFNNEIEPGAKAQSMSVAGELPQTYETSEPLAGRYEFNNLQVRRTKPQDITRENRSKLTELWLAGTATRLRPNDALLIQVGSDDNEPEQFRLVDKVEEDFENGRTRVELQGPHRDSVPPFTVRNLDEIVDLLSKETTEGTAEAGPPDTADTALRLTKLFRPDIGDVLYQAWANATVTEPSPVRVFALRVRASLFGHNASPQNDAPDPDPPDDPKYLFLDTVYPEVKSGTLVVVDTGEERMILGAIRPTAVSQLSRSAYGITTKTTFIAFDGEEWPTPRLLALLPQVAGLVVADHSDRYAVLRLPTVYTQSEELAVAEAPIARHVCGSILELAGMPEGLEPGRLLVVSGERADIPGVKGVPSAELVTVAEVRQGRGRSDQRNHTFVVLAGKGLRWCYQRSTVKVFGNVVHATHGESRSEILGSGDAKVAHQRFTLRSSPLTHVSAPTPSGTESTLEVRVDGVRWPGRPWFLGMESNERGYLARTDEQQVTSVVFPDGKEGRRLPTGPENVRARYRSGIGRGGNTAAEKISLLATKPPGVKEVVNPVPATGGADPESRDSARAHAPLPLKSLDRLVSLSDYADFARVFGGVGKASADRLPGGRGEEIAVTIAGDGGIPVAPDADVVKNLRRALRRYGDPSVRIRVLVAERLVLTLTASVRILADRDWLDVGPAVRATLLGQFGFDGRELGEDLPQSVVLAAIQGVPGVHSAVIDAFGRIPVTDKQEAVTHPGPRLRVQGARRDVDVVRPAQHLYLAPELPELLQIGRATP
jgi:hypothetical protein